MGTFHATVEVGGADGAQYETIEAMVDTGSTYTWVPSDVLAKLGVQATFRRQFLTADGRTIERDMAETKLRLNGQERTTTVVFGDEGSIPLLGAYILEGFGLAVDPLGKRLIPVPGYALKLSSTASSVRRDRALALSRAELKLGPYETKRHYEIENPA